MTTASGSALFEWAREFLESRSISSYGQIRTDDLAESFREYFDVPPFARISDLRALCSRLGIAIEKLPPISDGLFAINSWYGDNDPAILLRADVSSRKAESTLGHELREVIENAFIRVSPSYAGLPTHDNKLMNPESEFFAGCLLMPTQETRTLMAELGYDMLRFSRETGRSLPSVLLRAQSLFSAKSGLGPVAGIWLFEAPWERVQAGEDLSASDLVATQQVLLNGFSLAKGKGVAAQLARQVFPSRHTEGETSLLVRAAVEHRRPCARKANGFDLFDEQNYFVAAEPVFLRDTVWRVLYKAIRMDSLPEMKEWMRRIRPRALAPMAVVRSI